MENTQAHVNNHAESLFSPSSFDRYGFSRLLLVPSTGKLMNMQAKNWNIDHFSVNILKMQTLASQDSFEMYGK